MSKLSPALNSVLEPTISIGDAYAEEGEIVVKGQQLIKWYYWPLWGREETEFIFPVYLSQPSQSAIKVDYQTINSTATSTENFVDELSSSIYNGLSEIGNKFSAEDYIARNDTLTFEPGEQVKNITVTVLGDFIGELDEYFYVDLHNPTNATLQRSRGIGAIENDDRFENKFDEINKPIPDGYSDFYRLRNIHSFGYLFASEDEVISIFYNPHLSQSFVNEGFAFRAVNKQSIDNSLQPFYRFRNIASGQDGQYLFVSGYEAYTLHQDPSSFIEEGIAFFADYAPRENSGHHGQGYNDFYRYRSLSNPGSYLFATSPESDSLNSNPNFVNEGAAFSLWEQPKDPNPDFFRLRNIHSSGYLFASYDEVRRIFQNPQLGQSFAYDGFAFCAGAEPFDPLLEPYYRFRNIASGKDGQYLFVGEDEANGLRKNSSAFLEEGLAFFAYPAGVGGGLADFYRYRSLSNPGSYLFATLCESQVLNLNPNFVNEGAAFATFVGNLNL